jgi:hypothetical protein
MKYSSQDARFFIGFAKLLSEDTIDMGLYLSNANI